MKKLKLLTAIGALFAVQAAHAVLINGQINISGNAVLDSSDLSAATQVDSWNSTAVSLVSGDFSSNGVSNGDAAVFSAPWIFGSGLSTLWTVGDFTFDLSNSTINAQTVNFINITGTGFANHASYDPSPGTFTFTATGGQGSEFTFSSGTTVPDSGATAALLGLGLIALGGVARRFKK